MDIKFPKFALEDLPKMVYNVLLQYNWGKSIYFLREDKFYE